ncbi:AhpA/YtjB family protein [Endozoicomonas sp. YOMI1]|uniref:AhpA/YtjB family protein n=1 Tax=Endozoicomonas sp. YOMI1 TaxID=2828739 RepID=UPI0021491C82|nr:AhpA/YtjB family protein [Endozoicomonas sp. YOMI1]
MNKRIFTPDIFTWFTSRFSIRTQLMVIFCLLMATLTIGMSLVISNEIDSSSQHQADSIGQLLSEQTASAATDMLVTGDRLSLNVLLSQLVQNPYVAEASIYSIDNQRIAKAIAKTADEGIRHPVYSSPIHYQDVIAGYARLSLNEDLLSQKPKEALLVIIAISLILLLAGLIFLQLYASSLATQLRLIERQLRSILPTGNPIPPMTGEITRLSAFAEQQLLEKNMAGPEENVEEQQETAMIAVIKVKNLGRLQQLLAPRDLQDILRTHSQIISEAADYYDGEVTYTPEGNAYLRFSSKESPTFTSDALFCCLMIEALVEKAGAINIAKTHIGIGLSVSDQQAEFPEEQHPALGDSAASQALTLANLPEMDGIYMRRSEASWLPSDLPDFAALDSEVINIKGIKNEQANELRGQIFEMLSILDLGK